MFSQTLHRQLSSLNRSGASRRLVTWAAPRSPATGRTALPQGCVIRNQYGQLLVCEQSLEEAHSDRPGLSAQYAGAFRRRVPASVRHEELSALTGTDPAKVVLLDLETTGLHGRPLFMVGMMRYQGGALVISQLFARDYAEEKAVVAEAAHSLASSEALVSFNGKSFDLPYLRDRMSYHRLGRVRDRHHVDVLHHARRRWGDSLPNCRLQTLETHICGRRRAGDIPGHLIPQRYFDFVNTGDARLIAPVFHHNCLDLITMAELLIGLLDGRRPARRSEPLLD